MNRVERARTGRGGGPRGGRVKDVRIGQHEDLLLLRFLRGDDASADLYFSVQKMKERRDRVWESDYGVIVYD